MFVPCILVCCFCHLSMIWIPFEFIFKFYQIIKNSCCNREGFSKAEKKMFYQRKHSKHARNCTWKHICRKQLQKPLNEDGNVSPSWYQTTCVESLYYEVEHLDLSMEPDGARRRFSSNCMGFSSPKKFLRYASENHIIYFSPQSR